MGAAVVHILPRSPDLNLSKNGINKIKHEWAKGALQGQIQKESFNEFKIRVLQTLFNYNSSIIDHTVATLHDRLRLIASNGGYRTMY